MFYSLSGKLIHLEPGAAVISCAGIGFLCRTTQNTQKALPPLGEEVTLFTQLNVREDGVDLYGFYTLSERNCFKLLTAISGVGPKVGLSILSVLTPEQVAAGGRWSVRSVRPGLRRRRSGPQNQDRDAARSGPARTAGGRSKRRLGPGPDRPGPCPP